MLVPWNDGLYLLVFSPTSFFFILWSKGFISRHLLHPTSYPPIQSEMDPEPGIKQKFMNLTFIRSVRNMAGMLWLILVIGGFDSFSMFSVSPNVIPYYSRVFNLSDKETNALYAKWGVDLLLMGVPLGFVIDRIGIKKSLILGSSISVVAKVVFATASTLSMSLFALLVLIPIGVGLLGSATEVAISHYGIDDNERTRYFAIQYAILNAAASAAFLLTDFCLASANGWAGYSLVFRMGAAASAICFGLAWFYEEVDLPIPKTEPSKSFESWVDYIRYYYFSFRQHINSLPTSAQVKEAAISSALSVKDFLFTRTFIQLLMITIIWTGFRTGFRFMESLLVTYLIRVRPDQPYGIIIALNPTIIVFFSGLMGELTTRFLPVYWWIVLGMFISAMSLFLIPLFSDDSLTGVVSYQVVWSIGEMMCSSLTKKWVMWVAPVHLRGSYNGVLPIASFGGNILAGLMSGELLGQYCPQVFEAMTPSETLVYNAKCSEMWTYVGLVTLTSPVLSAIFYPLLTWGLPNYFEGCGSFSAKQSVVVSVEKDKNMTTFTMTPQLEDWEPGDKLNEKVEQVLQEYT